MKIYRYKERRTDSRESVAGVGNEHTGLANGAISDGDTLYKLGNTHYIFLSS